jgi:hypothetical protein
MFDYDDEVLRIMRRRELAAMSGGMMSLSWTLLLLLTQAMMKGFSLNLP